ncbi:MAG: AI-2E family transporter [Candidatus Amulumruptor caecigallinarius]|nr:AI-2E family transporter [Candidatus Amulumruptor caecigallinarius]MCM1397175.1 AI-2E family transporter [Candidatus Amulumruptor caecigallinarius]MCM1453136.1 AI-2E family transporter [bacterium]
MGARPYTFDRVVRMLIGLALLAGVVYLISILRDVLLPFFVACLVAYILEPFVQYNRQILHLRGRLVAVFVTLFEALLLFGVLCAFLLPSLFSEVQQMAALLKNYAQSELHVPYLPEAIHEFIKRNVDLGSIYDLVADKDLMSVVESALTATWGLLASGISLVISLFNWVLVLLYVVFLMIDYDRLARGIRWMVPPKYRRTTFSIARDIKDSMNHYFRGQALVAFIVGILFCIGFLIIGLPMAIPLGLLIGLMNMVPYLQLVSIPLTAFLCLIYSVGGDGNFWSIFGLAILVYCVVQVIQDLFLTPKILGKAMGLNPAIILLSLSVWGSLLGIIGMIIALPLTTLMLAYYDRFVISRSNRRGRHAAHELEQYPSDLT